MVVLHVSNRHLELASVVAGIAAANGLITRVNDSADVDEAANPYKFSGTVAAVARSDEDFGTLAQSANGRCSEPDPKQWVWTDDYSDIVGSCSGRCGASVANATGEQRIGTGRLIRFRHSHSAFRATAT